MRLKNSIWSVSFKNPNVLAKRSHLWHVNLTLDTKASNVPTSTTVMNTPIVHTPSVHLTVTLTPESRECRESRNRPSRALPETTGPMHSGEGQAALVEQQRWEWSNRFHQVVNYLLDRWIVRDLTPFLKIVFWMTFVVGRVKETSQSAHAVSSAGTETLSPLQAALTYFLPSDVFLHNQPRLPEYQRHVQKSVLFRREFCITEVRRQGPNKKSTKKTTKTALL